MAIAHMVVLTAAILTLLLLPCAAAAMVYADEFVVRRLWTRRGRRQLRELRRLDRALRAADPAPGPDGPDAPTIEQLAHDLRRLHRQRRSGPTLQSEVWLAAVLRAYDARLSLACRCLGVDEHLGPLDGLDRELERLRVESELEAAGLTVQGP